MVDKQKGNLIKDYAAMYVAAGSFELVRLKHVMQLACVSAVLCEFTSWIGLYPKHYNHDYEYKHGIDSMKYINTHTIMEWKNLA